MNRRRACCRDVIPGSPPDDVTCRPFRVRPEARRIWQQHTVGTVGQLLGQQPPPPVTGGADGVNAREKLRTNRSQGRISGGSRQPMRALPINGVTEEALSHSKSSSSAASCLASPRSPRHQIDLSRLNGDMAAVEGVHGVRVISPGRQRMPVDNGGIMLPNEEIPSPNGGISSRNEGIPLRATFRRVPSSGDVGSGSLSSGVTRSSSANDLDRRSPHLSDMERPLRSGSTINSQDRPPRLVNGDRFPSPREGIPSPHINGEGIPSPTGEAPWVAPGGLPQRSVRLNVPPGDISDRSSDCDLRRERIRALVGSLRRSPTDGSAGAGAAADARQPAGRAAPVTSSAARLSEPVVCRFSDETRLSFRDQALERARAPYRAPSLAGSRKFKSSESLRDGASARPAATKLLSKRTSQSVTRLQRCAGDNSAAAAAAAARLGDKSGAVAAVNGVPTAGDVTDREPIRRQASSGRHGDPRSPTDGPSRPDGSSAAGPPCAADAARPRPAAAATSQRQGCDREVPYPESRDFVRLNRLRVSERPRRARSLPRSGGENRPTGASRLQPGSLPRYLVRRHRQWEEEERRRLEAAPDPCCPVGHSRMADEERLQTLDVLRENNESLLLELRSLPIAHTSSRLEAHRADLERQLQKVEEGIRIFSRPKVFIRNDS